MATNFKYLVASRNIWSPMMTKITKFPGLIVMRIIILNYYHYGAIFLLYCRGKQFFSWQNSLHEQSRFMFCRGVSLTHFLAPILFATGFLLALSFLC